MERHSKGEFHVLIKELKLFHHEFFFKHIATRHFDFHSDISQYLFCLIIYCNQQFHCLMILQNNLFHFRVEFFSTPKRKIISSRRKRKLLCFQQVRLRKVKNFPVHEINYEVDSGLYCSKRKNRQSVRINLTVENLFNNKFY